MTNKLNFTKAAIESLSLPTPSKRAFYYDAKTQGLALQVTASGVKTFYVYRWVAGKPERIRLGGYPELTIEQARRKAATINGDIATGKNPNDAKRSARAEWTLQQLFDDYLERHSRPHKKSWKEDEAQFKRYLLPWASKKLSALRKADVKALHIRTGQDSGHYAANRLLALLRGVFNYAIRERDLSLANPATGIKPYKEEQRERRLVADEIPAFIQALNEEPNEIVRDYVWLSLLTGARRANVLSMRWADVHIERATWEIPAEQTKNGKPLTVHLAKPALAILEARRASSESLWVFPGPGKTGHLVEPKKAWARILERAGIDDLRLHDLRRTLASWQVDTGASLSIVGKSLGHLNQSTTAIYARLSQDPVRKAVDTAVDAMLAAGGLYR